jgi:hypothetical protein
MPLPLNPYIAGDPVGNSPTFVGRDDVLRCPSQNAMTSGACAIEYRTHRGRH